jgi:hypothetical protein
MMYTNLKDFMDKVSSSKIIESQKTCANAALNLLHMVDPDSCLLGGAPRDWALGNLAKDLDIYLRPFPMESRASTIARITQALSLEHSEIEDVTNDSYYMHGKDNGVLGVLNVKNCFMPIQIVLCDRAPLEMLYTFHCSLSQAYYVRDHSWEYPLNSDAYRLETTMEFDISKQFQVNLVKKSSDPRYINKVHAKYPNYTPVYEA